MRRAQDWRPSLFNGWRGALVALFGVAMVLIGCAELYATADRYGLLGHARTGRIGIGERPAAQPSGWVVIERVDPGGSAERAGIRVGDLVRFTDPLMLSSNPPAGTVATLSVRRAGQTLSMRVVYAAFAPSDQAFQIWLSLWFSVIAASTFALLLGALVLWRGWGDPPALALGLGLVGFATSDTVPWWIVASPAPWAGLAVILTRNFCAIGLPLFPVVLYHRKVAPLRRGWLIALAGAVVLNEISQLTQTLEQWFSWSVPPVWRLTEFAMTVIIVAMACWWSWRGARDGTGAERSRFSILLFAGGLSLISEAVWLIGNNGVALLGPAAQPWLGGINLLFGFIAFPLALAYAVLRHRVIDLGFAFNRTVVYATFSALLLGSFGLIEWGVEHLLPEEWVKASAWIDAGAAVMVYLAFHRVHGAVEARVEQVFFGQWQRNEEALRRFVASAAHFEDTRALARAFADELARFGAEARVVLYRRHDGVLDRVAGNWEGTPRLFRDDDPAFALMRAERAPLDLGETHTDLPGVLALPMLDHGALAGLVLLDLKGNGALWRPDEVALLGWAAHEVGLALAALHAGLIETENRLLKSQLARLTGIIGDRLDRVGA